MVIRGLSGITKPKFLFFSKVPIRVSLACFNTFKTLASVRPPLPFSLMTTWTVSPSMASPVSSGGIKRSSSLPSIVTKPKPR